MSTIEEKFKYSTETFWAAWKVNDAGRMQE